MNTVRQEMINICNPITGEKMRTQNCYVVDDGKNKLLIPKQAIIDEIKAFNSWVETEDDVAGMNCSIAELNKECDKMCQVINNMTEDDMCKIMDCLPRWKNGNIRSTTIPLYMTGITIYEKFDMGCRITSIELSVEPNTTPVPLTRDTLSIFAMPEKTPNVFNVVFTTDRQYDKTDKAIIGEDLTFNKLEVKRNSYLKIEELVQGCVYADAKDKEYLYIGDLEHKGWISKRYTYENGITNHTEDEARVDNYPYAFLALTDKKKAELSKYKTFGEFMDKYLKKKNKQSEYNGCVYPIEQQYAKSSKSLKMVSMVDKLFEPEDMRFTLKYTHTSSNPMTEEQLIDIGYRNYTLECVTIVSVTDKKSKLLYTVHTGFELNGKYYSDILISTTNKELCNKKKAEYKKKHPDHIIQVEETLISLKA